MAGLERIVVMAVAGAIIGSLIWGQQGAIVGFIIGGIIGFFR